ncbi:hypothetical protein AAG614_12150 [Citromicrobium bathyomarinum]|jgi:hypothetical protein
MRKLTYRIVAVGLILGATSAPLSAQADVDGPFLQCVRDCEDFQPDQATVNRCINWCYEFYDPQ